MRLVEDLQSEDTDDFEALVITGDGKSENRRLRPLIDHYDDDRILWLPTRSERHFTRVGRSTEHPTTERRGWEALDAIKLYKGRGITRFLFIVDSEHTTNGGKEDLEAKIEEIASFDDFEIEEVGQGAYVSEFKVGSRDVVLYTAIVGDEYGFIEDCLGKLLELEWDNRIEEDSKTEYKSSINRTLSGGTGRMLIEGADRENLHESFPGLDTILRTFENPN